jgi:hypothetical protein
MATITPTVTYAPGGQRQLVQVVWPALANGDDGSPVELAAWADRSVQIEGAAFGGGTLTLQGSNDGTNWQILTDPQGNDIAKTAADLEQVTELTRYVRPILAGGAAGAVTITFLSRRTP